MKRIRRGADSSASTVRGLAVLLLLFAGSYKLGSMQAAKPDRTRLDVNKSSNVLQDIAECEAEVESVRVREGMQMEGTAHEAAQTKTAKVAQRNDLQATLSLLEEQQQDCLNLIDEEKDSNKAKTEDLFETVSRLQAEHQNLFLQVNRLRGEEGQEMKILMKLIGELAVEHYRLRRMNNERVETITLDYIDKLLVDNMHTNLRLNGDMLPPNKTELSDKYEVADQFVPTKGGVASFFRAEHNDAANVTERVWTQPSWNGFEGNQNHTFGIRMGRKEFAPTTVSKQIRTVFDYALCALGHNITDLAFPDEFITEETVKSAAPTPDNRHRLHQLVSTPFVSFCDDCVMHHKTTAFRVLCQGYMKKDQYGSRLFWQMRSRIVVQDYIRNAADLFIQQKGLENAIAVRFPANAKWERMCDSVSLEPLMYYSKVLVNTTTKEPFVQQLFARSRQHCLPEIVQAALKMKELMDELGAEKIYISTDMSDASWSALTSALPERSIVRFSRADAPGLTNDSEELLTDITIASMLKAVVVNRFDIVSALLTEDFLLATGFAFSRVYVW